MELRPVSPIDFEARIKRSNQRFRRKPLYNEDHSENKCLECGIDMGELNPRQLCGKYRCINIDFFEDSDDYIENKCLECGIDMGELNPRQLCGKYRCINIKPIKNIQPNQPITPIKPIKRKSDSNIIDETPKKSKI